MSRPPAVSIITFVEGLPFKVNYCTQKETSAFVPPSLKLVPEFVSCLSDSCLGATKRSPLHGWPLPCGCIYLAADLTKRVCHPTHDEASLLEDFHILDPMKHVRHMCHGQNFTRPRAMVPFQVKQAGLFIMAHNLPS